MSGHLIRTRQSTDPADRTEMNNSPFGASSSEYVKAVHAKLTTLNAFMILSRIYAGRCALSIWREHNLILESTREQYDLGTCPPEPWLQTILLQTILQ